MMGITIAIVSTILFVEQALFALKVDFPATYVAVCKIHGLP